jgi:DNA-binding beta-propeller fold protein YncE
VFVADPSQSAVLVYDTQARTAVRWTGNTQNPMLGPAGLAFGADGRLFVTDSYRGQVIVFDKAGTFLTSFGKDQLKRPGAVAVDPARGRIYVADLLLRQVLSFDERTFAPGKVFGAASPAAGSRRPAPAALAVNSKGQLYVADRVNCRVQVYEPDGAPALSFTTVCLDPGDFARASSIAIDSEDHVYVADAELGSLQVLTPDGRNVLFAGSLGRGRKLAILRTGIALDRADRIYLSEQGPDSGAVQILDKVPERDGTAAQKQARQ